MLITDLCVCMCVYAIMLIFVCVLCCYVYSVKSAWELAFIATQNPNSNKVFLSSYLCFAAVLVCVQIHFIFTDKARNVCILQCQKPLLRCLILMKRAEKVLFQSFSNVSSFTSALFYYHLLLPFVLHQTGAKDNAICILDK